MMEISDTLSYTKPQESKDSIKILENKWRRKLRDSKIFLDVNSIGELTNLAGETLNEELVNLAHVTLSKKIKYIQMFDKILASKNTTIPKEISKLEVTMEEKKIAESLESKTVPALKEYIEKLISTASIENQQTFKTFKLNNLKSNSNKKDYLKVAYYIKNYEN
jgi:hypothetical protein